MDRGTAPSEQFKGESGASPAPVAARNRRTWPSSAAARGVTPGLSTNSSPNTAPGLFAMIYHLVHNEQDAWDLAQDGFLKAWKSIDRFRFQSSFYTWLYRIMTNVAIDWLRKKADYQGGQEFDDSIRPPGRGTGQRPRPERRCRYPRRPWSGCEVRAAHRRRHREALARSIARSSCSRRWKISSTMRSPKRWVAPSAR